MIFVSMGWTSTRLKVWEKLGDFSIFFRGQGQMEPRTKKIKRPDTFHEILPMTDPWDERYIYKDQPNVGKYTSPIPYMALYGL